GPVTQSVITHNATYQADDLDAYDSNCNEISIAKAVLIANLSSYGSDVLSEYTGLVSQTAAVQDTNSSAQQNALILSVFEQLSNQVTNCNKVNNHNLIANETLSAELEKYKERFADFEKEINYLKQTLSEQSKEKELLTKTFNVFKNESKEKEAKNIDTEIALEKKVKELDNIVCKMGQSVQTLHMLIKPQVFYNNNMKQALGFQNPFYLKKAQQIKPMLYDVNVIAKETNVISIADSEETLMLEEESRSKMLLKRSDPMVLKQKVNIKPINYAELNRLSEYFDILNEVTEVQTFFNQMEAAVQQYHVDKQCFEIQKKQFLIKNDRLLDQIISQDIVNIVVNSSMDVNTYVKVNSSVVMNDYVNYVEMCNKCLELEAELIKQHNMMSNAATIAPGMYKLDPIILAPKVKNNREAHEYYLMHTMEQAAILREVVEQAKSRNPLNSASYSAYMYVKLIQELLGVKPFTSAKRFLNLLEIQKNDRIPRTPSSNEKNKVEVQSRKVKSSKMFVDANHAMLTATKKVPLRVLIPLEVVSQKQVVTGVYTRRPKVPKFVPNSKPKDAKSMTANRMEPGTSQGFDTSFSPSSSSLIDCRLSKLFCGSRGTNLYSLSIGDMMASSQVCLLLKATKTKSWLWHRRLSHLNFGAINHLARHGVTPLKTCRIGNDDDGGCGDDDGGGDVVTVGWRWQRVVVGIG
ncbi:integrase, catalytic region, zinc finger, CCHC-type containing protein, partial [Tanacetum coccineum]